VNYVNDGRLQYECFGTTQKKFNSRLVNPTSETTALRRTSEESCFWFGPKVLRLVRTHSAKSKQPAELGSAERQVAITNF
jgi:hypothetical protein